MPNPGVTTLATIRTAVQQRADMVNAQRVTTAELNGYINASAYELYDLLIQHYGDDYFASVTTFTTDGTNTTYTLPMDFYKALAVDLVLTTAPNGLINIPRFTMADRNLYGTTAATATLLGRTNLRYRMRGSNIWLMPLPPAGLTIQLIYVPRWTALVNDSDTFDGISGWEEYVVTDCVIKCLQKDEADASTFMAQKQALIARIEAAAANRDAANPQTTTDSLGNNGDLYPFGFGSRWY